MDKSGLLTRVFLIFVALGINVSYVAAPPALAQNLQSSDSGQLSKDSGESSPPATGSCQSAQCDQIIKQLQQQKSLLTRELAQIKREIAMLRESMSEPGLREIFGGIGYILGLVGVAFYVHCRKTKKGS